MRLFGTKRSSATRPELAVPFELVMRTAGAEASGKWDRIFGSGLFRVTTKAVECPYCMGHCEMNWEVSGLNSEQIATRSRLLSDSDWSAFPVAEQHAYAFARKLSKTPWKITEEDVEELKADFGKDRAFLVLFNASRYHYMTRISNGFQLTLEKENVFYAYYNQKPPVRLEATSSRQRPWSHSCLMTIAGSGFRRRHWALGRLFHPGPGP